LERAGTPAASRDVERAPSLPDASAIVVPQEPLRAAGDAGMSATADVTAVATADAASAVVDQVVKSMRVQWKNGVGEARIQLRPEHLGPVDISIKVDGGSITAVVRAESSQVQEWILSHQQSLRQQLEAAGLRLDALVVSPDAERRHGREEAEARQHTAHRRRRPAGETPIFEVTV
jgi:flagellar hook-length control protein FliK